jgi:hypothetical protein
VRFGAFPDCQCGHSTHVSIRCRYCCCREYEPAVTAEIVLQTYYGLEPELLLLVLE